MKNKKILWGCMVIMSLFFTGCGNRNTVVNQTNSNTTEESVIQSSVENIQEGETFAYVLNTDINNGLLYSNADGRITDSKGQIIDYYSDISVDSYGHLVKDGILPFNNYYVGAGGKICTNIAMMQNYDPYLSTSAKKELKPDMSRVDTNVVGPTGNGKALTLTFMEYDGNVLDELLANAWFDDSGNPLAECLPEKIADAFPMGAVMAKRLAKFTFVDGLNCTISKIQRKSPSYDYSYALLVSDINKYIGSDGKTYNSATEYYSQQKVIFTGNFTGLLNGDDGIIFCVYKGLNTEDTPVFEGYFLEFHNDEF